MECPYSSNRTCSSPSIIIVIRLTDRRRGLTTPRLWREMLAELENGRNDKGRLPVSIEIITGQAWSGQPAQGVQMVEGEARVSVSDIITRPKDL